MNATRVPIDAYHLTEAVKRSAYVQRIRRSFLLRVHPDRFRFRPMSIRNGQSDLLKAFSVRFIPVSIVTRMKVSQLTVIVSLKFLNIVARTESQQKTLHSMSHRMPSFEGLNEPLITNGKHISTT